jgi:hypothetical protein
VLVAAAVCPHPPLLIPAAMGAAGLADAELRELRACCADAVAGLLAAGPELLVVVGGAADSAVYAGHVAGSLRPFGVPATVGSGRPVLPLSLTVGAWLLEQAGRAGQAGSGRPGGVVSCRLQLRAVAADMPTADCLRLGAGLAGLAPRVALLAMGDASDRYDSGVAAAFAAADPGALAALDPALDDELKIAGRAAWQVLAGAAAGASLRGRLRCAVAPYDVSYLVASWESAAAPW